MSANYLENFKNPPSKFLGAPFWAWNNKLGKETLLKQMDYFKEMGMGGVTIHCRTGLDTPYLSDEFMELIKACIEKGKEIDMEIHLYDEDRWPSGFGGGEVTQDHSTRSRYLVFSPAEQKTEDIKSESAHTLLARYDITLENGYLKKYQRLKDGEQGKNVWNAFLEISKEIPWFNNQTYVNTLDKKAIEKFIEHTYEKYYSVAGEEFGKIIPSIFTDEPQFERKQTLKKAEDRQDIIMPYTDDFEESYKETYQESFLDHLPEIFFELLGNNVSVTRYRYHDHIAERFAAAFSDTVGTWCKNHGIKLTGHMMEEPTLHSQTAALGEAMRHYRGFQMPGIDILCDNREYTTAKQAQSAAHQLGISEITSELYGVTNWDYDFRGHKLQGDWQAALGVTHRVHHLSWCSMEGEAKRDYPASIFYQSPWYQKYKQIETYFGRINTALRSGSPCVKVGVIHPVESYWLYFGPEEQTFEIRNQMEQQFRDVTEWLLFGFIDFDFISESLLRDFDKDVHTENAKPKGFCVGNMSYDVIIIPNCKTLRSSTIQHLNNFIVKGGEVIILGELPQYIDGSPIGNQNIVKSPSDLGMNGPTKQIRFDQTVLLNALENYRIIDMKNESGIRSNRYIYQIREDGDHRILFIANAKADYNKDVPSLHKYTITMNGIYKTERLDPFTGEREIVQVSYHKNRTLIACSCYDHDSLLFYLTKMQEVTNLDAKTTNIEEAAVKANKAIKKVISLNNVNDYTLSEPNVLMLDQARFSIDGSEFSTEKEEVLRIDNILRQKFNYPLKMERLAQPWTDASKEKELHTLQLCYEFYSEIEIEHCKLAIESQEGKMNHCSNICLNDENVPVQEDGYYVDECIKTIPLPKIRKGENRLLVTILYHRKTNLEWCYILGDFGVKVFGSQAKITEKPLQIGFSDLAAQDFPFYGGNISYTCEVDVEDGDYEIEVTKYRAPLLAVLLDNVELGVIQISPYKVELGHLSGKHRITILSYGNRVNTFGPVHNCNEEISWYGPGAWRSTGHEYSYEYQLRRTGILAAPRLIQR